MSEISSLTGVEWAGMEQSAKGQLQLRVSATTDIKDLVSMQNRVFEYIHIQCLERKPPKLGTLNRCFHRPATRLMTSAREVVDSLISTKRVNAYKSNGATIVLSVPFENAQNEFWSILEYKDNERARAHRDLLESAE